MEWMMFIACIFMFRRRFLEDGDSKYVFSTCDVGLDWRSALLNSTV